MAELIAEHDAGARRSKRASASARSAASPSARWPPTGWSTWSANAARSHPHSATTATCSPSPARPTAAGKGKSPGHVMAALGDRPAAKVTTREVSAFLRELDGSGVSPRTVNKYRQVLSAIFNYGRRERTPTRSRPTPLRQPQSAASRRPRCSTSTSPRRSRRLRRPPPMAWHHGPLPAHVDDEEIAWRRREDAAGRRDVPPRRLHRPAPRRAARTALGGHRP